MARRKQKWIEDDGSDSSSASDVDDDPSLDINDPDIAAERELFANPYGRRGKKRTREEAQEDATYGIWAQGDEEPRGGGSGIGSSRGGRTKKTDYLKCVTSCQHSLVEADSP